VAPVLEGVEPEVSDSRGFGMAEDPENPALLLEATHGLARQATACGGDPVGAAALPMYG